MNGSRRPMTKLIKYLANKARYCSAASNDDVLSFEPVAEARRFQRELELMAAAGTIDLPPATVHYIVESVMKGKMTLCCDGFKTTNW